MKKLLVVFFLVGGLSAKAQSYEESIAKEFISNDILNSEESMRKPYVIMVSIDGFRHDYAEKFQGENILSIKKNGASAERLIPSFPSKTFPNHYTLVSGLYPQNHGIVSNSFYDKERETKYAIPIREVVEDGSWYGGVPLWNLAQQQEMVSASFFWVGSEANVNGLHPKYYYTYDKQLPYEHRIQRVLEWLKLPEKERPHLITLYFSLVDTQGHRFGPDSEECKEAVLYVDQQIGALQEGLRKSGLPVTLLVTADHGMSPVTSFINIHDYVTVDPEKFYSGPVAMIYTENKEETDTLFQKLIGAENLRVYRKEEVPAYLNFSNGEKIGDLVLITESPYTIIYSEEDRQMTYPGGTHGYDPYEDQNMGALFCLSGPEIKENYTVSAIENIHVYPLVAHLLGLKISQKIDGDLEKVRSILK
ncbi:alkaline phosphatase family protein [Jiulongibacter sp. NS-SX5]|uniref:alkaline phosphatase family protein n=1 Tax=Jiulongibacter sp. NS-SX5 TaxID=3463854 RepID=UPI0040583FAE